MISEKATLAMAEAWDRVPALEAQVRLLEKALKQSEVKRAILEGALQNLTRQRTAEIVAKPEFASVGKELFEGAVANWLDATVQCEDQCNSRNWLGATCDCGQHEPCVTPRIALGTECSQCAQRLTVSSRGWLRCVQCELPFCDEDLHWLTSPARDATQPTCNSCRISSHDES